MLCIARNNQVESSWHIGSPVPKGNLQNVESIFADGDELTHIVRTCPLQLQINTGKKVLHFYGDLARTILLNL